MAKFIDTPVVDFEKVSKAISRLLRSEIEKKWLQMKEVQTRTNFSQWRLSQVLWSQPSKNLLVYQEIAEAIWLSEKQFEKIVEEAKQQVFWVKWEPDMDYALSSELGNNPDAIKEVKGFMQFVKQKYQIKK